MTSARARIGGSPPAEHVGQVVKRTGTVSPVGILSWIVVGFVAGALARAVTGGARDFGCLGTIVIGVVGGLLGGALFNAAGDEGISGFGLRSMFVAFVGACVLLLIAGVLTRGRYGGRRGFE